MNVLEVGHTDVVTKPETHYGVRVLRMHVAEPIPSPRAPERAAVLVGPDLARYLLTFNHPRNRRQKPHAVRKYAHDMAQGAWRFTPESVIFSQSGILQNGQNRLLGVIESGQPTWLMLDFGWPDDLIQQIDRGSARTNSDGLAVEGVPNPTLLAGAYTLVSRFMGTVGTSLSWSGYLPTSSDALAAYRDEPDAWRSAVSIGMFVYKATTGLGPSTWAAAAFVIARKRGWVETTAFFEEVRDETGASGSATRRLKAYYIRRRLSDTVSHDPREPLENIVRAFNAWAAGKPVGFVRTGGAFVLTPVRKR